MPRRLLFSVLPFALLAWPSPLRAVDFFWTGPDLGGPGGNFRNSQNWTFTPPPFPLDPAPGGAGDTANFDLGRAPEDRYTVTNVNGENDQMLIHDDSLRLEIDDYQLLSVDDDNPSFIVGVTSGDEADVILSNVGNATLRTKSTVIGLGVGSIGEVTADHLQWDIDGELNVGGQTDFAGGTGGDGVLTIENGSLVASGRGEIGDTVGSIGDVTITGSSWTLSGSLGVGGQGIGTLVIQDGSTVSSLGASILGNSTATVDGEGSAWDAGSGIRMFQASNSTLHIQNGGRVRVETLGIGCCAIRANSSTEITLDSGGVLDARGTIEMNNGAFNFLGGTLHVSEFDGNLVNQGGALAPGNPDEPTGATNITGNYTHQLSATLHLEIGGATAGAEHDFVNVEGTALFAGELELALSNDFAPASDDAFVVFNTDDLLLGSFSNVADGQRLATIDGGGSFVVRYGPTSTFNANQIVLTSFMFSADFDEDGDVDGDDLAQWRGDFGVNDLSDADNDGDSDGADFLAWQQQLGSGLPVVPASAAVPEPSASALLAAAALGGLLRRRRS